MKRAALLVLSLALVALFLVPCFAEEGSVTKMIALLPSGFNINTAAVYSFRDQCVKENSVVQFVSFINTVKNPDGYIHIDLGFIPPAEPTIGIDWKLVDLGKWVQFPVIKYVQFNPYAFYGIKDFGGDNREDYGVGAIFFQIKK